MKKTLLALAVAAVAANSAQAYTLLDEKDTGTGTKLEFLGSARVVWRSTSDKTTDTQTGEQTKDHVNHAIANNGSRFGFRLTQQLSNDFYALGRVEWRFRGTSSSQHDFDDIYTRQLYAGIGHKEYGELTYGHQTVITDEVKRTDLPNTLSLSDGLLVNGARKSVQYVYKGIKGLKVGAFYGGSSKRGNTALDLAQKRDDVWGIGAIYTQNIDKLQSYELAAGVTRESFESNSTRPSYDRTAYALGGAYTYGKTTLGLDLERRVTKDQNTLGNERKENEVRTVVYHRLTDDLRVYGMYAYKTNKLDAVSAADTEKKTHEFMAGTEYQLISKKDNQFITAKTFVEGKTARSKNYTNGVKTSKNRDNQVAVGLRVYW